MTSREFLDSWIIGQSRIKEEVSILMDEMLNGANLNLIFQAPSGYGKNLLATVICNYLGIGDSNIYLGESVLRNFNSSKRIHILDEIHELKDPESVYPVLDSGEFVILLLSNEWDTLKEPLVNRCIPIEFSPYSLEELGLISSMVFLRKNLNISMEFCIEIAKNSRGVPRVAELTSKRLSFIFRRVGIPESSEELEGILFDYLRIERGGMTERDKIYLDFLENQGGPTGLDTISYSTNLTKNTIRKEIEPFLIRQNLIKITPRGRILI